MPQHEIVTLTAFDLLTIGHSNQSAEQFLAKVKNAGVTLIADVRSVPFSRRFPWFSSRPLAERLHGRGIAFVAYGDALGGRPTDPALYCDGIADYEAMAETAEFRAGLDRLSDDMRRHRVCLMCSEREPLDCHRCLLVGRALARRGVPSGISWATARSSHTRPPKTGCWPNDRPSRATCSRSALNAWPRPIAGAPARSPPASPTACRPGPRAARFHAALKAATTSFGPGPPELEHVPVSHLPPPCRVEPAETRKLLLVIWAATVATYLVAGGGQSLSTDDAMRLVQVRDFLAGQGWFDLTQYRLDPPDGVDMHWSRLIDLPIALLIRLARWLAPSAGRALGATVWPAGLLLALLFGAVRLARELAGDAAARLALIFAALMAPVLQHFRPGAIDHHNVQLVLMLWSLALLVRERPRDAALAGTMCALSLAIGQEMAPVIAGLRGLVALRWIMRGDESRTAAAFGMSFAAATLVLFVATVPPARYTRRHLRCALDRADADQPPSAGSASRC